MKAFQKIKKDVQRIWTATQNQLDAFWCKCQESSCQNTSALDGSWFLSSSSSSNSPLLSFMNPGFMYDTITDTDKLSSYTPLPSFMYDTITNTDKLIRRSSGDLHRANIKSVEEAGFGYFYASRPLAIDSRQAMDISPMQSFPFRPPPCNAPGHRMLFLASTLVTDSTTSRPGPDEECYKGPESGSFEMADSSSGHLQSSRAEYTPCPLCLPFANHTTLESGLQPTSLGGEKSPLSEFENIHAIGRPLRFPKKKIHSGAATKQKSLLSSMLSQGPQTDVSSFSKVNDYALPANLRQSAMRTSKKHSSWVMKDAPKVDMTYEDPNQHVLFWLYEVAIELSWKF
ncbi:hypothetical protein [Absidia glauca]|uniref:Uncharacterized protein n=1 Tax=Absidia glauca TaxID=4829 RepID=A0A163JP13_ABSGL|nr:hypothetical protein [Absidia glauca]